MFTWCVNRSRSAPVSRSVPKVSVHSSNGSSAPVLLSGTKPGSSMFKRLTLASWRSNRSRRFSSRASINSFTKAAAVTKATGYALLAGSQTRPGGDVGATWGRHGGDVGATWVLPVPDGPGAMTFSRRSIQSHRASSGTIILFKRFAKYLNHLTLPEIMDFNALNDALCLKVFTKRCNDGIALKSKLSRLLTAGNLADLILRSTIRRISRKLGSDFARSRARISRHRGQ